MSVVATNGSEDIIIGTRQAYSVRFNEDGIRVMGRSAAGVKGITLREDDSVIGVSTIKDNQDVLIVTEKGFGKRTPASAYPTKNRGGKGIKTANITERNGSLAGLATVTGDEDLMVITDTGVVIRTSVAAISETGRSAQGVKLMRLADEAKIVTFALVASEEDVQQENEE